MGTTVHREFKDSAFVEWAKLSAVIKKKKKNDKFHQQEREHRKTTDNASPLLISSVCDW